MDRLLTAEEVAERLGMRTDWVWAHARAGRIPHVRLGRFVRFRAESIEQWLEEIERGATINGGNKRRGAAGTAPGMAPEA